MLIKEVMKKPMAIEEDISLERASSLMTENHISSLIYIKNGKIEGILTEEDLLRHFSKKMNISAVIHKNVITIEPQQTVEEAVSLMRENKISILPVVRRGELLGVVSATDLINVPDSGDFLME